MLVRHPDHTVGQARSASVKPISGRRLPGQSISFFMDSGARRGHELLLANSKIKHVLSESSSCFERENRIRQQ